MLVRLLLLEPGTNPLHPGMGVGISPKYRYMLSEELPKLQRRIEEQTAKYLPIDFNAVTDVYLKVKSSGYLQIIITSDEAQYIYDTEFSSTPIEISDFVS
jgi:hypothetical protein